MSTVTFDVKHIVTAVRQSEREKEQFAREEAEADRFLTGAPGAYVVIRQSELRNILNDVSKMIAQDYSFHCIPDALMRRILTNAKKGVSVV